MSSEITSLSAASQAEHYLARQLQRASRHVKLVDLLTALLAMVGGTLFYLLLLAVIDAWVLELTPLLRVLALVGLACGLLVFALRRIGPLVLHTINPAYAAKMIEETQPGFKNSLLNFLSLRSEGRYVSPAVLQAVQGQNY